MVVCSLKVRPVKFTGLISSILRLSSSSTCNLIVWSVSLYSKAFAISLPLNQTSEPDKTHLILQF